MWSCDQSLVTLPQFYKDLTKKNTFFEEWSWFKFNNLGLALWYSLQILHQCGKRIETKSQKVLGEVTFVEVAGEKLIGGGGGGAFWSPILNRVKIKLIIYKSECITKLRLI